MRVNHYGKYCSEELIYSEFYYFSLKMVLENNILLNAKKIGAIVDKACICR